MDELRRFFRQLVQNVAASDPARLRHALPISEIRQTILPYRANRRALQLESSEDYELVLIRLCAGDGGFARTQPQEAHAAFAAEAASANPDLSIVDRHEDASIVLSEDQLIPALRPASEFGFAPPDQRLTAPILKPAAPTPTATRSRKPAKASAKPQPPADCRACGGTLPHARPVKFCPHCGQSQSPTHCPRCQNELEPEWRHCVTCGTAVNGP
jgi:double zinc ribbon protein